MHRALVTGASGFIGSRLCKDAPAGVSLWGTRFRGACPENVAALSCSLEDKQSLVRAVEQSEPEVVAHLAYDQKRPQATVEGGTRLLLEAMGARPGVRLILLSTGAVFDGERAPYRETDEPLPLTPYGRAKKRAEAMWASAGGLVVRIGLTYGFDPPDPRTAALYAGLCGKGFPHPYFDDEIRSPLFVGDLSAALWKLAFLDDPPPVLHLAGPQSMSRYELARRLAAGWKFSPEGIPRASARQQGAKRPRDTSLDCSLARSILGFAPCTVEQAMEKETLRNHRRCGEKIRNPDYSRVRFARE
ncbi:MAG: sugar nucleotide-binding protein [Deltaproteobacteria bacterium]|nr:sugar nucleotide-binding protein [Deltaproteobacteria bacterium]